MVMTLTNTSSPRPLNGALERKIVAAVGGKIGDSIYVNVNDQAALGRANAAATAWAKGIVVSISGHMPGTTFVAGMTIGVCFDGPLSGWTGMDVTKPIYQSSTTAGGLTQTAPAGANTWTHVVGYPITSDVWMVRPNNAPPVANS